jgi:hypothetical protein
MVLVIRADLVIESGLGRLPSLRELVSSIVAFDFVSRRQSSCVSDYLECTNSIAPLHSPAAGDR